MDTTSNAKTMNIGEFFKVIKKHLGIIFFSTLLVTLASAAVTFFVMTPKYSATTQILVNRNLSSNMAAAQFQQNQADVQMISTYKDIISSPTILNTVNSDLKGEPGYNETADTLKKGISIQSSQNSQVFSISAKNTNPETAALIANETAKVFKNKIKKIMNVSNVSIVSKAQEVDKPVSPHVTLNIAAGVVLGILLGVGLALMREMSDTTVPDEDWITDVLGIRSLGAINEISPKDVHRRITPRIQTESNYSDTDSRMSRRV